MMLVRIFFQGLNNRAGTLKAKQPDFFEVQPSEKKLVEIGIPGSKEHIFWYILTGKQNSC